MDPKALFKVSYGLYAITSKKGSSINGQIAMPSFRLPQSRPLLPLLKR